MSGARLRPPEGAPPRTERRVHLVQGEFHVSGEAGLMLSTTLGSCIATCLYDPLARLGGMNHFLLPHGEGQEGPAAIRYGAHAMELLINGLLRAGARKSRLEAKVFGGGRQSLALPDVGAANSRFAEHFLRHEGIPCVGGSTRGRGARRIQFWPEAGRARQMTIVTGETDIFRTEHILPTPDDGAIELFGD